MFSFLLPQLVTATHAYIFGTAEADAIVILIVTTTAWMATELLLKVVWGLIFILCMYLAIQDPNVTIIDPTHPVLGTAVTVLALYLLTGLVAAFVWFLWPIAFPIIVVIAVLFGAVHFFGEPEPTAEEKAAQEEHIANFAKSLPLNPRPSDSQ
jgi:hypothetical protein